MPVDFKESDVDGVRTRTDDPRASEVRVRVPLWPDRKLGPNGDKLMDVRKRARITKAQKTFAYFQTRNQYPDGEGMFPHGVSFVVIAGMPSKRHKPQDKDNFGGVLKSITDGIAKWLSNGDDSGWSCAEVEWVYDPEERGYVEYVITEPEGAEHE